MTQEEWDIENEKLDALFKKIDVAMKERARQIEQEQSKCPMRELTKEDDMIITQFLDELHI